MADTTHPPRSLSQSIRGRDDGEAHALVLIWSRDAPARAGEALLIPPGEPGATWMFGRDGEKADERSRSLGLTRQRPGVEEPTGPLACPRISREQLRVTADPGGALVVENVGRCPMIHDGKQVARAELRPGDVVELRHELVLLCARRPRAMPALRSEGSAPGHPFGEPDAFGLVGEGPAIWELRRAVSAVARRSVHVLVLGGSGSGKELVARAVHALSPRGNGPIVARNAATFPEGLLDAELFGHAKNFPNPGTPERPGIIGEVDGGTLFLDEIAELPMSLQAHLLRVLDEGEYHRLGEARARRADLRLVAATNRPEEALKHDILARFKARLVVPGLDARREDIPLLVAHLLRRQAADEPSLRRFFPNGDPKAPPRVTPDLITMLVQRRYTTNVRELDALLLCASNESHGKYVDLTDGVRRKLAPPAPPDAPAGAVPGFTPEEQRRLALQRKHGFKAAACGHDPEYGANRQTADLHLRQLMTSALAIGGWDVDAAAAAMAGGDQELRTRLRGRIETFLVNLQRRREEQGSAALRRALSHEWRASAPAALRLLDALEEGQIRGRWYGT